MKLIKYSKYKNSWIDWIWEIPEDWEVKKMNWNIKFDIGFTPSTWNDLFYDWNEIWITIWDMKEEYITDSKSYLSELWVKWYKKVKKWSLLYSFKLSVWKVAFAWKDLYTNEAIASFKNNNNYDLKYLYYHFPDSLVNFWTENIYWAKMLNQELIKSSKVLFPPLQTQQKISTFLDSKTLQIEKLIEKDKNLIDLLKEKRVSLINQAVTKGLDWKLNKFKHLFNFSKWLNITKENLEDEWIPCVNYWEIHSKYGFELDPEINLLKCVSEDYLKISRKSLLKKGDFIFSDTSEDLKWSWNFTYLNSDIKTFAGYHTVIARHIWNINSRFFAYFFDSELFRSQIRKVVKWVKVYSITNSILNDTLIWYPERTLQDDIVIFLDRETVKIDNHIKKVERRIELYEEYKKSLIYSVVTGKVEV